MCLTATSSTIKPGHINAVLSSAINCDSASCSSNSTYQCPKVLYIALPLVSVIFCFLIWYQLLIHCLLLRLPSSRLPRDKTAEEGQTEEVSCPEAGLLSGDTVLVGRQPSPSYARTPGGFLLFLLLFLISYEQSSVSPFCLRRG